MYIMKITKYYKLEPLSYPQSPLFNSEPLARNVSSERWKTKEGGSASGDTQFNPCLEKGKSESSSKTQQTKIWPGWSTFFTLDILVHF